MPLFEPQRTTQATSRPRCGGAANIAVIWVIAGCSILAQALVLGWRAKVSAPSENRAAEQRPLLHEERADGIPLVERELAIEQRALMALVAEVRQSLRKGPVAKGEVDELMQRFRSLLSESDVAELTRTLSPDDLASPIGTLALEAWLSEDSLAACSWISRQATANDHHAYLAAKSLVQSPELLVEFCATLGVDSWAQSFLDHSSRALLPENPKAAVSLAESLRAGELQNDLYESIAFDWMTHDPDAARTWINEIKDPALRSRLISTGAASHASTDPLQSFQWLLSEFQDGEVPAKSLQAVAAIWRYTANADTIVELDNLLAEVSQDVETSRFSR